MADDNKKVLTDALESGDAEKMAETASAELLARMNAAEDLLEKRHQRKRRTRFAVLGQAMVGYVALAGFFANAYQNYNNKRQAEERARADEERWAKEFKRAQDADKYRAFFETSALATDTHNADKRLVGYALLKEFVDDKDYNSKATFMLGESLALELRDDTGPGLDEPHRAAVVAILSALSHTSDCKALATAARSVDKIAHRKAQSKDIDEARQVFELYALRLVGRAALVCSPKGVLDVRKPLHDFLARLPELGPLPPKSTPVDIDKKIAQLVRERCKEEIDAGLSECAEVPKAWARLCEEIPKQKLTDGAGLCAP